MKKIIIFLAIILTTSICNAQTFNIKEADFYIDLGNGDWVMQTEAKENLPKGVIQQYYFTDSISTKGVAILISENDMSKNVKDLSNVSINKKFLDGLEKGLIHQVPGNSKTLKKETQKINTMNCAIVEFINTDNPNFNTPIYYRDFITIKNGKIIHFIFMYFSEQALNNNKQKDLDTLKTVAFSKDSINDVDTDNNKKDSISINDNDDQGVDLAYTIGEIFGKSVVYVIVIIILGSIWALIKRIFHKK